MTVTMGHTAGIIKTVSVTNRVQCIPGAINPLDNFAQLQWRIRRNRRPDLIIRVPGSGPENTVLNVLIIVAISIIVIVSRVPDVM